MTKRDKILKLFNDAEWIETLSGHKGKTLLYEDFSKAGLAPTIEYQETYCDVLYARRIFNKMGFTVYIGAAFHIVDKKSLAVTSHPTGKTVATVPNKHPKR